LANNRSLEDRMKALRVGIDDFYINEFSAKKISQRIEFLEKYKGLTENTTPEIKPNLNSFFPKFEMPLFKRAFDIVFSTVLLIIFKSLFLVIAILIKLESKGPVFYVSHRAGSGYKIFKFYKFRTMKLNAEKDLEKLLPLNKYHGWREDDFLFFKIDKDPRVTKFGNILRKTCLDELPQLINVLIGDMSMVGNRPLPLYEAERLTKDQFAKRFLAPAGITGLWQISKRDSSDFQEDYRMDLDLKYANQSSFWFDIKIIIKNHSNNFSRRSALGAMSNNIIPILIGFTEISFFGYFFYVATYNFLLSIAGHIKKSGFESRFQ
jgi:lipopolysaccharide/colanic/teichoic acid biosynthesis glycosyltransferase